MESPQHSLEQILIDQIDALFAEWDKPDSPGCALGVIKEGQLVYERGYGMANLDYNIPITSDSAFYIASTSKQFTAACIVLLAQRGKLSLDDDIRKHLPEIPSYERPIRSTSFRDAGAVTIRHLVHHTSGLRDHLTLMRIAGKSFEDYFNNKDAIEMISRQKALNFQPGEEHLYSNAGYVALAEIVERVSGQSLREFAQENIFGPLGMHNTQFDDDCKEIVRNRVASYESRKEGGLRRCLKNEDSVGDGGVLTTVRDLYLWDQNLYHHKVGGSDFIAQMLTRGVLNNGEALDYAFGLTHGEYRGLKTVSHGGGWLGFRCQMTRFPEQAFTVICLSNLVIFNPDKLVLQVADLYLADEFSEDSPVEAQFIELSPQELEDKVGVYQSPVSGMTVELFVQEGKLMAKALGYTFEFAPVSAAAFRALDAPVDVDIQFEKPSQDQLALMHISVGSQKPDTLHAIEVASPTAEQLAEYAGKFYSDELQATFKLVVEDGKLYARHRGAPEEPLQPGPGDEFRFTFATLHFMRNDQGTLSGFTVSAGRVRNIQFVKDKGI